MVNLAGTETSEPEISAALADLIASWRRVFHQTTPAHGRDLLRRAANELWAALTIDATMYPAEDARALARQAAVDGLSEFAEFVGIAPDDAQQIMVEARDTAHTAHCTPAADADRPRAELRVIRVKRGELHEAVRQTQEALIAAAAPVFYRGGVLVRPVFRRERSKLTNEYTVVSICLRLTGPLLSNAVAKGVAAYEIQDRRGQWVAIDPPMDVIDTVLALAPASKFPTLVGIIDSPTMRPDATLLTECGYDAVTELWHQPAGDVELSPIADRPMKEDARAALRLFTDLLIAFPFKSDVDRSVALAAVLTVILRGAFDTVPLFLFLAPEAGTGKTYLIRLIAAIASGRDVPATVGSRDPLEMDKRLVSSAFEASPILFLNNLSFDLDSDMLCQMITDGIISIRPLGKSEQIRCDCRATTVFANGNNIRVKGDLVRRTLTGRLDARTERPETRQFAFDPIARVRANRGAYLSAAFTIVRAYVVAGRPDVASPLAGFDAWSQMVRAPLIWLSEPDPAASIDDARALDPERENLRALIEAIRKNIGVGKEFTAADCERLAGEMTHDLGGRSVYARPDFRSVMLVGGRLDGRRIGRMLMRQRDRRAAGCWIEIAAYSDKTSNTYRLVAEPGSAAAADDDAEPRL